jgi:hypothetical protein
MPAMRRRHRAGLRRITTSGLRSSPIASFSWSIPSPDIGSAMPYHYAWSSMLTRETLLDFMA